MHMPYIVFAVTYFWILESHEALPCTNKENHTEFTWFGTNLPTSTSEKEKLQYKATPFSLQANPSDSHIAQKSQKFLFIGKS